MADALVYSSDASSTTCGSTTTATSTGFLDGIFQAVTFENIVKAVLLGFALFLAIRGGKFLIEQMTAKSAEKKKMDPMMLYMMSQM
jgi:hypothetical protein